MEKFTDKETVKKKVREIRFQWDYYKRSNGKSMTEEDFRILRIEAKKYGVLLRGG